MIVLLTLALLMRVAVPSGFMVAPDEGHAVAIRLCDGGLTDAAAGLAASRELAQRIAKGKAGRNGGDCPFSILTWSSLTTHSMPLAVLSLALALRASALLVGVQVNAARHLRPPLRGPPPRT